MSDGSLSPYFGAFARLLCEQQRLQPVVLAVSGGADSLGLMAVVARWCDIYGQRERVFVGSVDHGLRERARAEAVSVVEMAERLGFQAQVLKWDGPKPESGIQAAARDARYEVLTEYAQHVGATRVVTAHTADDQIETFFMRLMRGSGVQGLAGMREVRPLRDQISLVRPLLGFHRAEMLRVVAPLFDDYGLRVADDPSNGDPRFERVRVRRFLDLARREGFDFDPVALSAKRLAQAHHVIADAAQCFCEKEVQDDAKGGVRFARVAFDALAPCVQQEALVLLIAQISGERAPLSGVERVVKRLHHEDALVRITLSGCQLSFGSSQVRISVETPRRHSSNTDQD